MKPYTLEETMNMNMRSLNRSPYRNMPEKCLNCAYASKPSAYGVVCTGCVKSSNKADK